MSYLETMPATDGSESHAVKEGAWTEPSVCGSHAHLSAACWMKSSISSSRAGQQSTRFSRAVMYGWGLFLQRRITDVTGCVRGNVWNHQRNHNSSRGEHEPRYKYQIHTIVVEIFHQRATSWGTSRRAMRIHCLENLNIHNKILVQDISQFGAKP